MGQAVSPYQLHYLQNVQNTDVSSNGHRVSSCIFTLGAPYFLTVLSERDFKAWLVLNKNDIIPLSQITVRSGWRSTEKYHLGEFLNWSLEVSEAERCFRSSNPRDKCQMYLSFRIFVFFFSKQNLILLCQHKLPFFMHWVWYEDWHQHDISCPPEEAVPYKEAPLTEPNAGMWTEICSWRGNAWSGTTPIGSLISSQDLYSKETLSSLPYGPVSIFPPSIFHLHHTSQLLVLWDHSVRHAITPCDGHSVHSTAHLAGNPSSCYCVDQQPSSHRQAGWGFPSFSDLQMKGL